MDYKDTLEKYAYFQPVLKEICPKVFEANDDSEQNVKEQKISPVDKWKSETVTNEKNHPRDEFSFSKGRKKLVNIPDWTDLQTMCTQRTRSRFLY